jgi:hypothetical protein
VAIVSGYATLNEYKAWIAVRGLSGNVGTDTSDDSSTEILIESASRYLDRETGRRFYPDASDGTYYFQAQDAFNLDLPDFASITSVSVDYGNTRSYTALTLATDCDLLPDNYAAEGTPINAMAIAPTSSAYFPTQRKGVKIVGKRGWLAAPTDIKEACLSIAQSLNGARSGQSSMGKMTVTAAGVVIRPEDVPAFAQKIIAHYRDIR